MPKIYLLRNKDSFYGEDMLTPFPIPKLEAHPMSAVRDCLFNIFAATLNIGGRFSIRNLRTRNATVTRNHLSWILTPLHTQIPSKILMRASNQTSTKSVVVIQNVECKRIKLSRK